MSRDSRVKLAGITAAVTATAAAGYYAYDQYTKRYPKYQEQLDMYKEVRAANGGSVGRGCAVSGGPVSFRAAARGWAMQMSCIREVNKHA
jgi:hypothetical protein